MTRPALIRREWADLDVENAVDYYRCEAGPDVALRFIDAVCEAYRSIANDPAIGSARYADQLDIPGLRFRSVRGFPYLVFYRSGAEGVEVWRVLQGQRDIPGRVHEAPD